MSYKAKNGNYVANSVATPLKAVEQKKPTDYRFFSPPFFWVASQSLNHFTLPLGWPLDSIGAYHKDV